jgi:methylmalonyl-CoA/ethylmalonyl-CoA epimerase
MFSGVDHIAIAVNNMDEALEFWRDRFHLNVILQEKVNDDTVLLTHLSLGNVQLQLVEPLIQHGPLYAWLKEHGPGLHHFCLKVDDTVVALSDAVDRGLATASTTMHQGTNGKRAVFLDKSTTGVLVELTGP